MCWLCKKGWNHCEDCGMLVCLDAPMRDDLETPAHFGEDGQILCDYHYEDYLELLAQEEEENHIDWDDYLDDKGEK